MLKDEHLIKKFKRTADGILFEAFPFFMGFFFHSVFFNPPAVNVTVNKRLAAHVTFLDTACTSIINLEAPNSKN